MLSLSSPNPKQPAAHLLDWLELQALTEASVPLRDLLHLVRDSADADEEEINAEEAEYEDSLQAVITECKERSARLGLAYPFQLENRTLTRSDSWTSSGVAYVFCLVLSHSSKSPVVTSGITVSQAERLLFEQCAGLSAAAIVNGQYHILGTSQEEGATTVAQGDGTHDDDEEEYKGVRRFLGRLSAAFQRVGEGKVRTAVPAGRPRMVKDSGFDIVAWGDEPDGLPGRVLLFGQAASGANWVDKRKVDADNLYTLWFESRPASAAIPAMFVPYALYPNRFLTGSPEELETQYGYRETLVSQYGHVYCRHRLPRRFEEAGHRFQERAQELRTEMLNWVRGLLA